MNDELKNFKAWYVDVLSILYPIRDAGIAVLMVSLPLLERYLRQKNQRTPNDSLDDASMRDLCSMLVCVWALHLDVTAIVPAWLELLLSRGAASGAAATPRCGCSAV